MPVSGSDRLSPAREEKLWWKICLHPHLEQGGTPPVESSHGCGCHFFLNTVLIVIKLNDPHLFPHQKQYPLKPKVKEWVKSYCNDFS